MTPGIRGKGLNVGGAKLLVLMIVLQQNRGLFALAKAPSEPFLAFPDALAKFAKPVKH